MNKGIIIQARMGSSRLPGKVLADICGKPMLLHVAQRLRRSKAADNIIIASSDLKEDDAVYEFCRDNDIDCFRGSSSNVLERYYECARKFHLDIIVRVTGDCPLICPCLIDKNINLYLKGGYDCISPRSKDGLIRGLDNEIFSFETLEKVYHADVTDDEKEHVTLHIYNHPEKYKILSPDTDNIYKMKGIRLCVDEASDLELIRFIYGQLYKEGDIINIKDAIELLENHPKMKSLNSCVMQVSF